MRIKLHGTRGAYPTTSKENHKYGGNTSCIEIINVEVLVYWKSILIIIIKLTE